MVSRIPVWYYVVCGCNGQIEVRKHDRMLVKEIMTTKVTAVSRQDSVRDVAKIMHANSFTGLPVVDGQRKLVGIITEYDLMSRDQTVHIPTYIDLLDKLGGKKLSAIQNEAEAIKDTRVEDVMTCEVVTVSPETDVKEVAKMFITRHINPIPVVDRAGDLVGIVSRSDVIKLFI